MTSNTPAQIDLRDRPVLSGTRAWLLVLLGPLAMGGLVAWASGWGMWSRIEGATIDWRFQVRGTRQPPSNIVIVEIDDESRQSLKHDGRAFNLREHLAPAIDHISRKGALVVGLDIWLEDLTTEGVDERLSAVIAESNVVLAVAYSGGRAIRAAEPFLSAGAVEGLISVQTDHGSNVLRRTPPALSMTILEGEGLAEAVRVPHFPLALALFAALEKDENSTISIDGPMARLGGNLTLRAGELVDYIAIRNEDGAGAAGWKTLRFDRAVRDEFPADLVDGAIVLIGEARMVADSFVTPLSPRHTPGVYYHANVTAQILADRHFDESWSAGGRLALAAGGMTFVAGVLGWLPLAWRGRRKWWVESLWSVIALMLFCGGWIAIALMMFGRGVVLPVAAPGAGMALVLLTGIGIQWVVTSIHARRLAIRARQIERLFSKSVSERVLAAIKHDPAQLQETRTREVSVLFCDLRNYTGLTENLEPAAVSAMLNEYYDHISAPVFENDGFLDKFVGDAMMAVYSAPIEQVDHVERAVQTAIAVRKRLTDVNRTRATRGEAPLMCGLGIHCGPAALGYIGSGERANYTVVGTTVNLASRIEHLSKGGEILISEDVKARLPESYGVRPFKRVELRGAAGLRDLFEVLCD